MVIRTKILTGSIEFDLIHLVHYLVHLVPTKGRKIAILVLSFLLNHLNTEFISIFLLKKKWSPGTVPALRGYFSIGKHQRAPECRDRVQSALCKVRSPLLSLPRKETANPVCFKQMPDVERGSWNIGWGLCQSSVSLPYLL